ncbi:hypothetical protein WJX81_007690 [Elliptochloris bilobata]|uniref:Inner centromere protein ARK-binding domain-containing protein n=1 Tax=Elliptochloris bilobata TaxID=381761 RepID=A0AAW1RRR2_9CHLO
MATDKLFQTTYHTVRSAVCLWCAGFKDALCIWRCVEFFVHDPRILRKTGQCFALNGAIFLGSVLLWEHAMAPGARFLLAASLQAWAGSAAVDATVALLHALFLALWLLPVYCVSFALSCVWYQEIAQLAVQWQCGQAPPQHGKGAKSSGSGGPDIAGSSDGGLLHAAAQEVFRVALFAVFFLQVSAVAFVPVVGKVAYFVLVSWLYALYSFDYKWSLTSRRLQERIAFFEQHWAFFLGFGSVCTLATMYWTFFKGAAIMAIVYPLFILVACKSDPLRAYREVAAAEAAAGRRLRTQRVPEVEDQGLKAEQAGTADSGEGADAADARAADSEPQEQPAPKRRAPARARGRAARSTKPTADASTPAAEEPADAPDPVAVVAPTAEPGSSPAADAATETRKRKGGRAAGGRGVRHEPAAGGGGGSREGEAEEEADNVMVVDSDGEEGADEFATPGERSGAGGTAYKTGRDILTAAGTRGGAASGDGEAGNLDNKSAAVPPPPPAGGGGGGIGGLGANLVSTVRSFLPFVARAEAAEGAPAGGKKPVKVRALEAADAARRREAQRAAEREKHKAADKQRQERARRAADAKAAADEEARRVAAEAQRRREEEAAARRRAREEAERREREEKQRRLDELRLKRKADAERAVAERAAADEEERKRKAAQRADQAAEAKRARLAPPPAAAPPAAPMQPATYEISPYKSDQDSDEEAVDDAAPRKPVPDWARGRALAGQLAAQLAVDPDEIFQQRQKTCPLDEVFGHAGKPTAGKRDLTRRNSSGNWIEDRVTWKEEVTYKKAMGYLAAQHPSQPAPTEVLTLRLVPRRKKKAVRWANDVVDNEEMNKKKSKKCCIFHKQRPFGDWGEDDDASDGDCEECAQSGQQERGWRGNF